ncbi:MAG: family 20 glycosylhydrolase [Bacteroidales bacterium]
MYRPLFIWLIVYGFFFIPSNAQYLNYSRDIKVSWELISNQSEKEPAALAVYSFTNLSIQPWCSEDWEFYFNQSPRNIIRFKSTQPLVIERLSGDWYRIKPEKGFCLSAGASFRIEYLAEAWWIKNTDAPAGAYWVIRNKSGQQLIPAEVEIRPFIRSEQISRFISDQEPLPNPALDYEKYQELNLLDEKELPPAVPFPYTFKRKEGYAILGPEVVIQADQALQNERDLLKTWLTTHTGIIVYQADEAKAGVFKIILKLNPKLESLGEEGYQLKVSARQVRIEAATSAGAFYGCQTLQALLPVDSLLRKANIFPIPLVSIEDRPRFNYRGMHLDVARNFIPLDNLLKIIDLLSFYKVNYLHLHLTDDEGWRIEIPALPELTQVGAYRKHTSKNSAGLHPAYGSGPFPVGGFYSRKDFVKILRYAAQRHITVIPEVNMPGHARAAIKAMEARYQRLVALGDTAAAETYRLIDPSDSSRYQSAQYYDDNVVCVVRESVYHFMECVIKELAEQYKEAGAELSLFHTGGDEVPHGAWTGSPMVKFWLKSRPEYRVENLPIYYLKRVNTLLEKRGIRAAGWEEIALKAENGQRSVNTELSGGQFIPYVWNNLWGAQDLAYRLANRNYPVVLCHVTSLYFDLAYNKDPYEPGLYWAGFVDEYKTWLYNPLNVFQTTRSDALGQVIRPELEYRTMERLKPSSYNNIMGLQAQLWSETLRDPEMVEYYMLPKLISFAQVAWAQPRKWESDTAISLNIQQVKEEWNVFANVLGQRELPRLSVLWGGFRYRLPNPGIKVEGDQVLGAVPYPGLIIRYVPRETSLSTTSPVLIAPLKWEPGKAWHFGAFDKTGHSSKIIDIE